MQEKLTPPRKRASPSSKIKTKKVHYSGALKWTNAKGMTTDILPGHTACAECRRSHPNHRVYKSTASPGEVTCRACLAIMQLAARDPLELIAHKAIKEIKMPAETEKKITRVRIEFDDGTAKELNEPVACAEWNAMAQAQAGIAFVHGVKCDPLPWKESRTVEDGRVALRQLAEKFLSWLDKQGVGVCERAWGEYRRVDQEKLSAVVDDFVADYIRSLP